MTQAPKQEEWDAIYLALGRAVSRWALAESALAGLFGDCANPENGFIATQAFWSIRGFDDRLRATERMMDAVEAAHPELKPIRAPLFRRVRTASEKRNKFAHGHVIALMDPETGVISVRLSPYHFDTSTTAVLRNHGVPQGSKIPNNWKGPSQAMFEDDIESAVSEFTDLYRDIHALRVQLAEARQSG